MKVIAVAACLVAGCLSAQEAERGLDLSVLIGGTTFAAPERGDGSATAGFRALLYPTWKLNSHWFVSSVVQVRSRPSFVEELGNAGYGLKSDVLQASLGYAQFWQGGSVLIRVGELPSAFGAFLLRYTDMDNALIDAPLAYGYYYRPVTTLGLMGAQVDATLGKLDGRVQLTSSSPANRRSPWAHDQYATWTAGAGYTIVQGFHVGVSAFRGPYLDRQNQFFFPGESNPSRLPATAYGADVSWARGHTSVNGEWQRFIMPYHVIPTFITETGFGEIKQVLHARWFVAGRAGYLQSNYAAMKAFEGVVGFRPGAQQLIKAGYQLQRNDLTGQLDHIVALQYVAVLHPPVWAGR